MQKYANILNIGNASAIKPFLEMRGKIKEFQNSAVLKPTLLSLAPLCSFWMIISKPNWTHILFTPLSSQWNLHCILEGIIYIDIKHHQQKMFFFHYFTVFLGIRKKRQSPAVTKLFLWPHLYCPTDTVFIQWQS